MLQNAWQGCTNTKLWTLPDKTTTCDDMVTNGKCKDGSLENQGTLTDPVYLSGKLHSYPELNCCACSAGHQFFEEVSTIGRTCTHKQINRFNHSKV